MNSTVPLLTIYKASAGSGKTWRLTVEYLKLLLRHPESYRNILAVTFTNKATGEMKERIMNALYEMMRIDPAAKPTDMLDTICSELNVTPTFVKGQAISAMSFLLHDYGRFHIETIDSFFQSILRNLARELGLGAYLNIELNNSEVLSDAVDAMVDKADNNPELLKWMTDYIEELVQEGKSWKIDQALKSFGQTIFKEYFKEKEGVLNQKLSDKGFLNKYKKELRELESYSIKQIDQAADVFFNTIQEQELDVEDFSNKESGICGYFLKLKQGKFDKSGFELKRVQACRESPDSWSTVKSQRHKEISALAAEKLIPLLEETEQIRAKYYPDITSCRLAGAHLNKVGLLTDISREVKELNRENNRFLLSDTNALLKSLIDGSDASFVYEKTGTELNHILFDEFQDTSRMQWDTFRPLLAESLANGYKSLIVGDEKQSIYRWRNGDWRILGNIGKEMRPAEVQEKVLKNNWRSERRIIEFNNILFQLIEKRINQKHIEEFESESEELEKAYKDVAQESNKKDTKGLIEVSFPFAKLSSDYHQLVLERLVQKVEELQEQGVKPNQIAILIRKNKYIPEIGAYFANYKKTKGENCSYCYDIISDEAFLLGSSKAVQLIIDALRLLCDPENPLYEAMLKLDYQKDVLNREGEMSSIFKRTDQQKSNHVSSKTSYKKTFSDANPEKSLLPPEFIDSFDTLQRMPLYELAEELYRMFQICRIPSQDSYLYAFMDGLSEYLQHGLSDIASFLKHWDERMSTTSIPAGSGINGIRIMSIHKSKGLEFHTVLIPFCDWKLLNEKSMQVWCQPETAPYNQLDLLPIDYRNEMNESCFHKEYQEETLQLWVDSINLLYVAFTRAKHNLIVFCQGKDPQKGTGNLITISDLIQDIFQNGLSQTSDPQAAGLRQYYREASSEESGTASEATFSFGELSLETVLEILEEKGLSQKGEDIALPFKSFIHKTKFKQSNRSLEFSKGHNPEGFGSSFIDRGKLLHKLFSGIRSKEDLPTAMQDLLNEGLVTTAEANEYLAYIEKAIGKPEVSDWFSDKYKLFNECSILFPDENGNLQLKRPDRVIKTPENVIVVDFKFGKAAPKYHKQVQEYMALLKKMGYTGIQGHLWYVDEDKIEDVKF
ncbi:MAG: UvrD-helicase domain-containing protein [Bacteroidales bacterium]|nr:UvrD-helicase domain-containing protein [Bacteroidales bacterium]